MNAFQTMKAFRRVVSLTCALAKLAARPSRSWLCEGGAIDASHILIFDAHMEMQSNEKADIDRY